MEVDYRTTGFFGEEVFASWVEYSVVRLLERDHGRNNITIERLMNLSGRWSDPGLSDEAWGMLLAELRGLIGIEALHLMHTHGYYLSVMSEVLVLGVKVGR